EVFSLIRPDPALIAIESWVFFVRFSVAALDCPRASVYDRRALSRHFQGAAMRRKRSHAGPPHVALIVMTSMSYGREILHGISQYIREYGPWSVYLEQRSLQDPEPPWLHGWKRDGIILGEVSPSSSSSLRRRLRIPTVDLDEQIDPAHPMAGRGRPHIQSDHRALGTLAAEHLLERGFSHFAYFGYPVFGWSRRSSEGFATRVQRAGYACYQYRDAQTVSFGHQLPSWEAEVDGASRWIASLPKPLGLMACND